MSIELNPMKIIEALGVADKNLQRVILGGLGVFAAIAIVQTFFNDLGQNSIIKTAGYLAVFYIGVSILSAFNGTIVKLFTWVIFIFFTLLLAFVSIVFIGGDRFFPDSKTHCAYADTFRDAFQCIVVPKATQTLSTATADLNQNLETPSVDSAQDEPERPKPWLSINHFAPFTEEDVTKIASQLIAEGWDVKGSEDGFDTVVAAKGVLAVRYSDPIYKDDATAIAKALLSIVQTEQDIQISDLSQGRWADKDNPQHIEVWLGKK